MRAKQSIFRTIIVAVIATGLVSLTGGCKKEGPLERAGKKVDSAVQDAGEAIEDAADKTKEAVDDTVDKIKESTPTPSD